MHKPLLLLIAASCALLSCAQQRDTLVILYKSDQYQLTKKDKQQLDSFLIRSWDRISINGHTDETDEEEYNLDLSMKRSARVYDHLIAARIGRNTITSQFFGEAVPRAANETEEGRALNRRTEIIGYRYARVTIKPRPVEDLSLPVTRSLDNGIIITYRPGSLPSYLAANFEAGSGMDLQLISNTTEMRQNNLFNNTTRGEILSSVQIISFENINQCKLDSPVLLRVPVPYRTDCNLQKLKFFVSVWEKGRKIWKEENKPVFTERINGVTYTCVWVDNFCGSVNFDFKIPECFDTDSARLLFVNADVRNLTTELKGVNSVYMPRKTGDSTSSVLFLKNKLKSAVITFSLFKGRRRIRGYRDQLLTDLPYNKTTEQYIISTGTLRFYFPRLEAYDVALKVNGDKYRIAPDNHIYEFTYLNRPNEKITVDFSVEGPGGRVSQFRNQPLSSLPYDELKGCYIIDKKFLRALKQLETVAKM